MITIMTGGRLDVDGASILVGPMAAKSDGTITGASGPVPSGVPRAADLRGKLFDFGPDGTSFAKPVLVSLPLPGPVPSGKDWKVAWLDTAKMRWMPLPTVLDASGTHALAVASHFTSFALLESTLVDTACPLKPGCGGALAPHYDMTAACFKGTPPKSGPLPFCPTGSLSGSELHAAGFFDFDTAAMTFEEQVTLGVFSRIEAEPACLTVLAMLVGGPVTACKDLEAPFAQAFKASVLCSGDPATKCVCYGPSTIAETSETGTYTTASASITLTTSGGMMGTSDYCVDAGNLFVTTATSDWDFGYAP